MIGALTSLLVAGSVLSPVAEAAHGRHLNTLYKKKAPSCGKEGMKCCLWSKCSDGLECRKVGWWSARLPPNSGTLSSSQVVFIVPRTMWMCRSLPWLFLVLVAHAAS